MIRNQDHLQCERMEKEDVFLQTKFEGNFLHRTAQGKGDFKVAQMAV